MPGPALNPVPSLESRKEWCSTSTVTHLALEEINLKANITWGFVKESSSPTPAPTKMHTCSKGRDLCLPHTRGEIPAQDSGDTDMLTRKGRKACRFMIPTCRLRWWLLISTTPVPRRQFLLLHCYPSASCTTLLLAMWLALFGWQQNYNTKGLSRLEMSQLGNDIFRCMQI